jgi:hypothetical protein
VLPAVAPSIVATLLLFVMSLLKVTAAPFATMPVAPAAPASAVIVIGTETVVAVVIFKRFEAASTVAPELRMSDAPEAALIDPKFQIVGFVPVVPLSSVSLSETLLSRVNALVIVNPLPTKALVIS